MRTSPHKIIILSFGLVVSLAFVIGGALRPIMKRRLQSDVAGSPELIGIATVTARFGANDNVVGDPVKPWAQVRYRGALYAADKAAAIDELREGSPARIYYRVGRSGRIVVDAVIPLHHPLDAGLLPVQAPAR